MQRGQRYRPILKDRGSSLEVEFHSFSASRRVEWFPGSDGRRKQSGVGVEPGRASSVETNRSDYRNDCFGRRQLVGKLVMTRVVLSTTNAKDTVPRSSGDDTPGRQMQVFFLVGEKWHASTSDVAGGGTTVSF